MIDFVMPVVIVGATGDGEPFEHCQYALVGSVDKAEFAKKVDSVVGRRRESTAASHLGSVLVRGSFCWGGDKKPSLEGRAVLLAFAYLVQREPERSGPVLPHHIRLPSNTLAGQNPLNGHPHTELMIEKVVRVFLGSLVDFLEVLDMRRFEESMNSLLQLRYRGRFLVWGQRVLSFVQA